jgi:hypothetical protein
MRIYFSSNQSNLFTWVSSYILYYFQLFMFFTDVEYFLCLGLFNDAFNFQERVELQNWVITVHSEKTSKDKSSFNTRYYPEFGLRDWRMPR